MRSKKLISFRKRSRRVAFSPPCGNNGTTFGFSERTTPNEQSIVTGWVRVSQVAWEGHLLEGDCRPTQNRRDQRSRLCLERCEAARNLVARTIRSLGAEPPREWIVTLLRFLARWMADDRALVVPPWAPGTAETLRRGPRTTIRPVDRSHSGWMTFLPMTERFGGPPDGHVCSPPDESGSGQGARFRTAGALRVSSSQASLPQLASRRSHGGRMR